MLSALSETTRLNIVRFLVTQGSGDASAGAVGDHAGAKSSRVSFHLSTLENARLINSQRVSRSIIYRANTGNLGQLLSYLLNDCCNGDPYIWACCLPDGDCC